MWIIASYFPGRPRFGLVAFSLMGNLPFAMPCLHLTSDILCLCQANQPSSWS